MICDMIKVIKVSKSTYFYNVAKYNQKDKDFELKADIIRIFNEHKARYGYRRVRLQLLNEGTSVSQNKVKRIMKELGLKAKVTAKKYKSYKGTVGEKFNNLLLDKVCDPNKLTYTFKRNFTTTNVNQKWATDVSQFTTQYGKIFLSALIDICSRDIVAYTISTSPTFEHVYSMMVNALKKHKNVNDLILHSDQGWQYQMFRFTSLLKSKNIKQSMSRKGNCLDNSHIENFFGIMKKEMFYGYEKNFTSLEHCIQEMKSYIKYYNEKRIIERLGGVSPKSYRQKINDKL